MEAKLQQQIESLERVSDIQNMDENNPIIHRLSNPTIRRVTTVVCSHKEPHNLVLPLNVVWFVYDPLSPYFRRALKRVSKNPNTAAKTQHQWRVIETMLELNEEQYYDSEDSDILNNDESVPLATQAIAGIARLSHPPADPADPIAVGEGDPRLSDARAPLPHSHAETPATMLKTKTGIVTISGSAAPEPGATLVATSATTAVWRKLTSSDVQR